MTSVRSIRCRPRGDGRRFVPPWASSTSRRGRHRRRASRDPRWRAARRRSRERRGETGFGEALPSAQHPAIVVAGGEGGPTRPRPRRRKHGTGGRVAGSWTRALPPGGTDSARRAPAQCHYAALQQLRRPMRWSSPTRPRGRRPAWRPPRGCRRARRRRPCRRGRARSPPTRRRSGGAGARSCSGSTTRSAAPSAIIAPSRRSCHGRVAERLQRAGLRQAQGDRPRGARGKMAPGHGSNLWLRNGHPRGGTGADGGVSAVESLEHVVGDVDDGPSGVLGADHLVGLLL